MFNKLLMVLAGILTLIGAGAISYTYLEQTVGPREALQVEETPIVVVKKEITKPATTTQPVQKKIATKALTPAKTSGSIVPKTETVQKTVVTPGPLRAAPQPVPSSTLTVRGVIEYTNAARALNGGFSALTENASLNLDAQMKVDDMFAKQYFEHVSPSGVGPADLAKLAGYAYVIVGENLALGDFSGDSGVVTAWMNSPGHRANILKPQYQEIGVAVGKGMYEGRETWLAVQSFGLPLSACPATNTQIKAQIDANNVTIAGLRAQLDAKKAQIDSTQSNDPNYNTYVNEFNAIVPGYNNLIETNRAIVATFNASVQVFNACIALASGN